jgi:hypothetical protein
MTPPALFSLAALCISLACFVLASGLFSASTGRAELRAARASAPRDAGEFPKAIPDVRAAYARPQKIDRA